MYAENPVLLLPPQALCQGQTPLSLGHSLAPLEKLVLPNRTRSCSQKMRGVLLCGPCTENKVSIKETHETNAWATSSWPAHTQASLLQASCPLAPSGELKLGGRHHSIHFARGRQTSKGRGVSNLPHQPRAPREALV